MIDELWDRQYRSGRRGLHSGIDKLARTAGKAAAKTFRLIHDIQFDAPWAPPSKDAGCA